jgi:hypothetical protein
MITIKTFQRKIHQDEKQKTKTNKKTLRQVEMEEEQTF